MVFRKTLQHLHYNDMKDELTMQKMKKYKKDRIEKIFFYRDSNIYYNMLTKKKSITICR